MIKFFNHFNLARKARKQVIAQLGIEKFLTISDDELGCITDAAIQALMQTEVLDEMVYGGVGNG